MKEKIRTGIKSYKYARMQLAFLFLICICTNISSQSVNDILSNPSAYEYEVAKSTLMDKSMSLVVSNTDSAFYLIDVCIELAKNKGFRDEMSKGYHAKAETCFMLGRVQESMEYLRNGIDYCKDQERLSRLYLRLGACYKRLGQQDSIRLYYNKGFKIIEEINDTAFFHSVEFLKGELAFTDEKYVTALDHYQKAETYADYANEPRAVKYQSLQLQAITYFVLGDVEQAIQYSKSAQLLVDEMGHKTFGCTNRITLANYQLQANEFAEALENLKFAKDCFKDRDLPNQNILIRSRLAYALMMTNNIEAARTNLLEAKALLVDVEEKDMQLVYYLNLGRFNIKIKQFKEAENNLSIAMNYAKQLGEDGERLAVLKEFISLEKADDNTDKTLKYTEAFYQLKDSLFTLKQANLAFDYESRYSKREQEKSIAELNMVNDVQSLKLEQQQKQIYWTSFLILGLLTLLYMAYKAYINKKKNEELLNVKNLEISKALESNQLLLKEIHHRVKNNLQVVSSLLNLQSRQIEDAKAKEIIKSGQDRIKSMALIHQNLHQGEDMVGVSAKTYIQDLVGGLSRSYNLNAEKILVETSVDDISMEIDKIIPIGLILNELVSNALKYAFVEGQYGLIKVGLSKKENNILLRVEDNGKGLPKNFDLDKLKSLGFRIVRSFTNKLKGKIDFPKNKKGTEVLVTIPA